MDDSLNLLTRRAALKRAAVALFGGTLTASQLGLLARTAAAMSDDAAPRFLSDDQFLMLKQIAGLIIPETDTPGAIGARVHYFIDLMLAVWASPARQARYVAGLRDIDRRAREGGGDGFSRSPPMHQLGVLQALDDEAFAEGSGRTFFRELKRMVLFAYYTSEPGATVELSFQRIPGDYEPCLPMNEVRAWFWNGYSYEL